MSRRVEITFEGLNIARTVTELSRRFQLFDVERSGRKCKIAVSSTDFDKVVAFLRERCYNITKTNKLGLEFALSFVRTHFLLPVFFVLAFVMLFVSSNFCLRVEISGDFSAEQVSAALANCDIAVGTSLFGFSADEVENKLCTELGAMYAVVTRKGSTLYVNAVEKKSAFQPIDMNSRRDIVSDVNGKVVSVLCEQGVAAVKVGDIVHKGDVLIAGLRQFNDGTTADVYAMGKVSVELSAVGFAEFDGTVTKIEDTGRSFCATSVELFGKDYVRASPFESYRTEISEVRLSPLNLAVRRVTYVETCSVTTIASIEDCLDDLKAQALSTASQQADFFVTGIEYRVTANGVFATVFGEAEID